MTSDSVPGPQRAVPRADSLALPCTASQIAATDAEIDLFIDQGRWAPRTVRGSDYEQRRFERWCADQAAGPQHGDLVALPARPETVATYLATLASAAGEGGGSRRADPYALASIRAARDGIGRAHRRRGYPSPARDPFVETVMAGIARSQAVRRPRQQTALTIPYLLRLCQVPLPPPTALSRRNQAAVLTSRHTGLSLAELAALPREAVTLGEGAAIVLDGRGRATTLRCQCSTGPRRLCPVNALWQLSYDLPRAATLAFGVVRLAPGNGTSLTYPKPDLSGVRTVARSIGAAVRAAGTPWAPCADLCHLDDSATVRLLTRLDPGTTRWHRDTAALLTAWHLALRGGEVGTLDTADLHRDDRGWTLMLGRTKADQVAAGSPLSLLPALENLLDPVAALDRWMALRGTEPGKVFCALPGGRADHDRGMTTRDVANLVRHRARAAGLVGQFSAHSLRIGFVVSAVDAGASIPDIMTVTRHRNPDMVGYYGRAQRARTRRAPRVLLGWEATAPADVPPGTPA